MTMPAELGPQSASHDKLSDLVEPWLDEPAAEGHASPQEINDRRARLENAEGLRLARSL